MKLIWVTLAILLQPYRAAIATFFPVRTESRAACRISTTITLFSSEFNPRRLELAARHAGQVVMESLSAAGSSPGLRVSSARCPGRRTRKPSPPVAIAYPFSP